MTRLREGTLNNFCNSQKNIIESMQYLYIALCKEFLAVWATGSYTETDFHKVMEHNIAAKSKTAWKTLITKESSKKMV